MEMPMNKLRDNMLYHVTFNKTWLGGCMPRFNFMEAKFEPIPVPSKIEYTYAKWKEPWLTGSQFGVPTKTSRVS